MDYRAQRREACQALFADFHPDYSRSRNPDELRKIRDLAAEGWFSHEIAEHLGRTPKSIQKAYRRFGFPELQNFCPPLREQRIGWAGGVKEVKGYLYARTPGHPYASKHGSYVAIHRLVLEQKLGRFLLPTEVVDHIDGDRKNNAPENLRVFQSNAEHLRETLAGRCPEWTEDGKERLAQARQQPRRMWKGVSRQPSHAASESDAGQ